MRSHYVLTVKVLLLAVIIGRPDDGLKNKPKLVATLFEHCVDVLCKYMLVAVFTNYHWFFGSYLYLYY